MEKKYRKDNAKTNEIGYLQEVGAQQKEGGNENRGNSLLYTFNLEL